MHPFMPFDELPQRAIVEAYDFAKTDWIMQFRNMELPGFTLDELMAAKIPDELSPDLEKEAEHRAQLSAFVTMFSVNEGLVKRWEKFPAVLLSPIVREDGELVDVDLTFVCRVFYLTGLYRHCGREFSPAWQERLSKHLSKYWPDYAGQLVTQRLLWDWLNFTTLKGSK